MLGSGGFNSTIVQLSLFAAVLIGSESTPEGTNLPVSSLPSHAIDCQLPERSVAVIEGPGTGGADRNSECCDRSGGQGDGSEIEEMASSWASTSRPAVPRGVPRGLPKGTSPRRIRLL